MDKLILLLTIILLINVYQCSIDLNNYIGAVVEYTPINISQPPVEYMIGNIKEYIRFTEEATQKGAQIIVFPEYGIIGNYFDPTRDGILGYLEEIPDISNISNIIIPCENNEFNDRVILQSLSCIALQYEIYIVVNMGDKVPCQIGVNGCVDGRFQYNTDVAFSPQGQIIAKYHKSHLYFEPYFDQPLTPTAVTFETSFNVTFGIFICFDIMFQYPQTTLMELGIRNLIYSTEWVNVPYAYAREIQEAWSYVNNNNILAANIGSTYFSSGSGIFSSGEELTSTVNGDLKGKSKLLISSIPKIPNQNFKPSNQKDKLHSYKAQARGNVPSFVDGIAEINGTTTQFYLESNKLTSVSVTQKDLTCKLIIEQQGQDSDLYVLSAFSGSLSDVLKIQVCWLVVCPNNSTENCNLSLNFNDTNVNIKQFQLSGNFVDIFTIYPSITSTQMVSISDYNESDNSSTLLVSKPINNFISTSIFCIQQG